MALEYNIKAEKGSTFVLHVKYQDDDGNAVNLTGDGYTAAMQVRRHENSSSTLMVFTSTSTSGMKQFGPGGVTTGNSGGSGGIRLNSTFTGDVGRGLSGSTGGIYIEADPTTMKNVPTGQHFYELDIIQGSTILRLIEGRFEVVGNIRQ